ncbi:glycoside hydrolase family 62 protein [Parathielavia appendiculata]|uniref:Alpha-L-arabinofuranosidase n=1 Tax=Parathielavia appendiculata TaxID=2587402 RepID=A0AAN6TSP7_9PEZI|nr:glycoside hydrolase family 62 protein [Parathielavia appendiculata]
MMSIKDGPLLSSETPHHDLPLQDENRDPLKMRLLSVLTVASCAASVSASPASKSSALVTRQKASLPHSFKWSSTAPLVGPKDDGREIAALKDPSIVEIDGTYHVFASTAKADGYNLVYFNFTDFSKANSAHFFYLDQSPIGEGYRAAPQVFYFAPQKLWYLIYQNGNAAYSTNADIRNPAGWTAPQVFYRAGMPAIIEQNIGQGYWVDMWVICDKHNCYLFSSDDNGHLYRSHTRLGDFPNNMSEPVIALEDLDNKYALYEAACVYAIRDGTCPDKYLLLIEAIGSDGQRYFRSWTSNKIDGRWKPLADTESNPFARSNNVVFETGVAPWTKSISHGEVVRTLTDQTLTIDLCNLRFLYQGMDPSTPASTPYNALPWRLGLITLTDPTC